MKKFMLTLLVLLPISIVMLVAFGARTIIRYIQYYPIQSVELNKDAFIWDKNGNPSLELSRGQEFNFLSGDIITVYPSQALKSDIKIVLSDNYDTDNARDILEINSVPTNKETDSVATIKANHNLTNQYKSGIKIRLVNKDNSSLKEYGTDKLLRDITINIKLSYNDPMDNPRWDLDYLLYNMQGTPWDTQQALSIVNNEEKHDNELHISYDNIPKLSESVEIDGETKQEYIQDNQLSIHLGLIVPQQYFKPEYMSFASSDTSIIDIINIDFGDWGTMYYCLQVINKGQTTLTFNLSDNNRQIKTATLTIVVE